MAPSAGKRDDAPVRVEPKAPEPPPPKVLPPRPDEPLPRDLVEKAKATRDSLLADMKRKETLLARAEHLLGDNMLSEANNVLNTFPDWGDLGVRASRIRLRIILAGGASNEPAARKYLSTLCADPRNGEPGGACEQAFEVLYAHAGELPPAGAGHTSFERKVELWKSIGQPPAALKKAVDAASGARLRLFAGYLKLLGDQAEKALRDENITSARQALDRASKFIREEKAEDLSDAVSRLAEILKSVEDLDSELKEWAILLPLNPGLGTPDQLKEDELKSRVEKFKKFAEKYPRSSRKITASNYQARFQSILDGRRASPR